MCLFLNFSCYFPINLVLNSVPWMLLNFQVAAEKPNPTIFLKACELLGVKPEEAVHIGDDRRNDIWGARDAGCDAWLWGSDVYSFKEVYFSGCSTLLWNSNQFLLNTLIDFTKVIDNYMGCFDLFLCFRWPIISDIVSYCIMQFFLSPWTL